MCLKKQEEIECVKGAKPGVELTYQRATDKVLPHLPQPDNEIKTIDPTEASKPEEVFRTCSPIANISNIEVEPEQQIEDQKTLCTIPALEAAWQDHLLKDQRARKWKMSTALQIVMDQNITLLSDIKIASAKAECLVSLLNDIAGNNQRLRYLHQRAVEQSHTLSQQSEQLKNASKFVIKSNFSLITECGNFLKDHADSYDILVAEKEKKFQVCHGQQDLAKHHSSPEKSRSY
jgi:hypothetical protein